MPFEDILKPFTRLNFRQFDVIVLIITYLDGVSSFKGFIPKFCAVILKRLFAVSYCVKLWDKKVVIYLTVKYHASGVFFA